MTDETTDEIDDSPKDWIEYLVGAAMALNPLPIPTHQAFTRSDRAALASDWQHAQMDRWLGT